MIEGLNRVDQAQQGQTPPISTTPGPKAPTDGFGGRTFADTLAGAIAPAKPGPVTPGAGNPVQFSGHALERIQRRGIDLDPTSLERLAGGVDRAAAKGGRESLVLVDGTAFVVSVPNRTVITAVDQQHMREQVFTNIDSAVIA